MITTVGLTEIAMLLERELSEPHHILGMHEIERDSESFLVVRALVPQAREITVADVLEPEKSYPMNLIHSDGFFEAIIPDRDKWFRYELQISGYNGESWATRDPYSFEPTISELDRHLFGEGTHYDVYKKMGAQPMTFDGVEGVSFTVWAPNARQVSVMGSFNSWDGRRGQMRLLGSSGIWEIFVPLVKQYDEYKFQIKTHDGRVMEKSDPFGSFHQLRPSTASLVYDAEKHVWNDEKWLKQRQKNNPLDGPINIYEVHLGSWKYNYDEDRFCSYAELGGGLIEYVKDMGYTHIEIMGISEYPFDGSWGYQVTGYYAPTSRYGNPDEFMDFVDLCHQNGIGVILDWVPAHFPKDAHGLAQFDGSALFEHEDPRQGEHPDWGTLIFNFGRKEVKNFLIGSALMWLERYHIDGLRVDAVASMLYLNYGKESGQWIANQYGGKENLDAVEFLKHMNSVVLGRYPHVLMVAEESTSWANVSRPAQQNGLGFNLKWNMGWMNDFLSYISKEPIHRKYHHQQLTFGMVYAYTENFVLVLSHDEVVHGKGSLVGKMPGDIWQKLAGLRVSLGFMYGHPGKKLIFMGGEFAQFAEWSEAKSLDWFLLEFPHHAQIQQFVKDLNHLYVNDEPLWYNDFTPGGFEWIDCDDADRSMVSFKRMGKKTGDVTIFICNFTPVPYESHRVIVPFKGDYEEVLNSDDLKYGGSGVINTGKMTAEKMDCDNGKLSIGLRMPPLGMTIIKPVSL